MAFGCFGSSSKSVIQPGLVANNEDEGVVEATEDDDIPMFDLAQLAAATDDFDESKILGSGGFGIVYKGTLNGQEVAIKRHSTHKKHRQAFWDEVNMLKLNRLRNPNVVRLIGYHATDDNLMMVLELMPLGSLDKHIYGVQEQPLNWSKDDIIFRDLKPANILLGEEFHPKLADFGLVKFGSSVEGDHYNSKPKGTAGYLDHRYCADGMCSPKVDVYAFGVLLFELMTGRKALENHYSNIVNVVQPLLSANRHRKLVDPLMRGAPMGAARDVLHLAHRCISAPADRPSMAEIVAFLSQLSTRHKVFQCLS